MSGSEWYMDRQSCLLLMSTMDDEQHSMEKHHDDDAGGVKRKRRFVSRVSGPGNGTTPVVCLSVVRRHFHSRERSFGEKMWGRCHPS
jgi:hypothetical protein